MKKDRNIIQGYLYFTNEDGAKHVFHFGTFKNIDPKNTYKINHQRKIASAVNFIMGRFHHFYKEHGMTPQSQVIITSKDLARNIKCSESQAKNIFRDLRNLFNLDYGDQKARVIKLNNRFIEALNLFTELQLQEYTIKYDIRDENLYRLRQIYNWRIFTSYFDDHAKDKDWRDNYFLFTHDPEIKDYHHYCATSFKKDRDRLRDIEDGIDLLTPIQKDQVSRIRKFIDKLEYYLHKLLIKLENKVSWLQKKNENSIKDESTKKSMVNDRNKTESEQKKTREVGSVQMKNPETHEYQVEPRDVIMVATYYNQQANGRVMDKIKVLTKQRIKSIVNLLKYRGKENVTTALGNLTNLYHDRDEYIEFMNFDRFTDFEYFDKILKRDQEDTRLRTVSNYLEIKDNYYGFWDASNEVGYDNIPEFKSITEGKQWFNSKLALM